MNRALAKNRAMAKRMTLTHKILFALAISSVIVMCCIAHAAENKSENKSENQSATQSAIKTEQQTNSYPVTSHPKTLSSECNEGRSRVYDECGSQMDIVNTAHKEALATNKTTLIVYGAEWCVWCHIFDDFAKGDYASEYFEWARNENAGEWVMQPRENVGVQEQAIALNQFVSDNFVIAHIEGDNAPDGPATITALGYNEDDVNFYPFIFSLNDDGQYADHMLAYKAMPLKDTRKNENGQPFNEFKRDVLLAQLKVLKEAAE